MVTTCFEFISGVARKQLTVRTDGLVGMEVAPSLLLWCAPRTPHTFGTPYQPCRSCSPSGVGCASRASRVRNACGRPSTDLLLRVGYELDQQQCRNQHRPAVNRFAIFVSPRFWYTRFFHCVALFTFSPRNRGNTS